jgi:GT2 family glycosyltransferase
VSDVDEELPPVDDDDEPVAPPVVAVVVVHDPGEWFEESLAALAAQSYPALSVLVIDAASAIDPTDRVAAVLPDAHVHRLDANPGFGAAANVALTLVEGTAFFLLCHDDIAFEPGAVEQLVLEAYRSNAGIVGPKLVSWDEPERLLQVGVQIDKSGHDVPFVERGELDQEQHDAVRDVFCVPGGATLVRADLFRALGGFDPAITYIGEDVDLCWRAQVAGARVLVVPGAVARHREELGRRPGFEVADRRRYALRHRLRAVLTNYSRVHRWRVVPQVAALGAAEVVYGTVSGRRELAAGTIDAWRWNRSPEAGVKAARQRVEALRAVPDKEVRRLQSRGSARFALFVRGQLGLGDEDRVKALTRSAGDLAGSLRTGPLRVTVTVWVALLAVLLVGSRHHLFGAPPSLVDLPQLPRHPWDLLGEWLSGWRRAGLGSTSPQATGFGLLGGAGTVLLGSAELLRKLLVLVPLVAGPIGASRLVRPTGSARAPWVAAITYAAIPLPYDALAEGRWGALVGWSAVPWIVAALARAGATVPFAPESGAIGAARARRLTGGWLGALPLGLLTAVLAAVVPLAALLPLAVAVLLVVGGLVAGEVAGAGRTIGTAARAAAIAAVLHLPWTIDLVVPGSVWSALTQAQGATGTPVDELLRFQTGPMGAAPVGYVFLVAAALPLLIGRAWRLGWAVRCWVLAAGSWGLAVVDSLDAVPVSLGPVELLLAPAACGLAMATALGMVAFEVDLRDYRFGWRQLASIGAAAAIAAGTVPVLTGALDGDWGTPRDGVGSVLGFLDAEQEEAGPFRTLWLGDPTVLPLHGWQLDEGSAWALTDQGLPNVVDRWPGSPRRAVEEVPELLALAREGDTARLGRRLAPLGIRYLVIVDADRPDPDIDSPVADELRADLSGQLDLAELGVQAGATVYRNVAWFPARAVLSDDGREAAAGDGADIGRAAASGPALVEVDGTARFTGDLGADDVVWQASSSAPGWSLEVDGDGRDRSEGFGFGNVFAAGEGEGGATLAYRTPWSRLLVSGLQAAAWALAVGVAWRHRRRRRPAPGAL